MNAVPEKAIITERNPTSQRLAIKKKSAHIISGLGLAGNSYLLRLHESYFFFVFSLSRDSSIYASRLRLALRR